MIEDFPTVLPCLRRALVNFLCEMIYLGRIKDILSMHIIFYYYKQNIDNVHEVLKALFTQKSCVLS